MGEIRSQSPTSGDERQSILMCRLTFSIHVQKFVMAELRLGHSVISVLMGPLIGWNWPARGGGLLQPGQGQLKGAWGNRESDPEAGLHGDEI